MAESLAKLVEDYLVDRRAGGLGLKTINATYGLPLRRYFVPFCEAQGVTDVAAIDGPLLNRFGIRLLDEPGLRGEMLSPFSRGSYLNVVNLFLAWCQREGEIKARLRVQQPRLPRRVIGVLSREEINRLEDGAKAERDKVIIRVLADTGIRVSELLGLTPADLHQRDREQLVKVRGKGDRERMVPVAAPETFRRLRRLARARPDHAPIFVSLRKDKASGEYLPITAGGVDQILSNLGREVLGKRVYPHLLRHSYATEAVSQGMHPTMLRNILGHSSLRMVDQVYSHLAVADQYEAAVRVFGQPRRK